MPSLSLRCLKVASLGVFCYTSASSAGNKRTPKASVASARLGLLQAIEARRICRMARTKKEASRSPKDGDGHQRAHRPEHAVQICSEFEGLRPFFAECRSFAFYNPKNTYANASWPLCDGSVPLCIRPTGRARIPRLVSARRWPPS